MFIFGLHSQLLMMAERSAQQKLTEMLKRPPKSLKNDMLIFGLRSTSDDQLSDLSGKCWPKCETGPLSHWKMKCSFLDYVQLLMTSQAISVTKFDQNVKKWKILDLKTRWYFVSGNITPYRSLSTMITQKLIHTYPLVGSNHSDILPLFWVQSSKLWIKTQIQDMKF